MSCSFCVAFSLEPKMCAVHCTKSDSLPQDLYTMTLLVGHYIFSSIFDHLTPNRQLAHTSFTYRKLNMDGFSVLNASLGYM